MEKRERCSRPIIFNQKAYIKQWRLDNKEKILEYKRQWDKDNKERRKQYCLDNKDERNKRDTQWRRDNPKHIAEYSKQYHKDNPEQMKQWQAKNPERVKEINRKHKFKRRSLGFFPLNKHFEGSEAHHINFNDVIYIPRKIHQKITHCLRTGKNMEEINELAIQFLQGS